MTYTWISIFECKDKSAFFIIIIYQEVFFAYSIGMEGQLYPNNLYQPHLRKHKNELKGKRNHHIKTRGQLDDSDSMGSSSRQQAKNIAKAKNLVSGVEFPALLNDGG